MAILALKEMEHEEVGCPGLAWGTERELPATAASCTGLSLAGAGWWRMLASWL